MVRSWAKAEILIAELGHPVTPSRPGLRRVGYEAGIVRVLYLQLQVRPMSVAERLLSMDHVRRSRAG